MPEAEIGIIGGSGLYHMPGFTEMQEVRLQTPFGDPSEVYVLGELDGRKVAFLARHGRGHRILMLERLIDYFAGHEGVQFTTMAQAADAFRARSPRPGA